MPQKQLKLFVLLALISTLSGCGMSIGSHYEAQGETRSLDGLKKVHAIKKRKAEKSSTALRLQSIRDYAFSIGAQAGCAEHTRQLRRLIDQLGEALDRIYNFNVWMLPNNVLPPVLIEATHSVSLVDAQTMRVAGCTYRIHKNARFTSVPPHWLYDYLLRDSSHMTDKPPKLVVDLLPKNEKEQVVWKEAVQRGWQCGIEQGRNNFMVNLDTLARDLNGIILYRQLLAKKIVSAPYIAYTDLGVTGDNQHMQIDDQVLRITTLAQFEHDTTKWQPMTKNTQISHATNSASQ